MAVCVKCESAKLTEQPCPKCGSLENKNDPERKLKRRERYPTYSYPPAAGYDI